MKIQITWTPVPQGTRIGPDGFFLKLSAVASIRVTDCPGATLAKLPALLDWPKLIAGWKFVAVIENDVGKFVLPFVPQPDTTGGGTGSAWWQGLFPASTLIEPFVFTPPLKTATYDPAILAKSIDDFYGHHGLAATGPMPALATYSERGSFVAKAPWPLTTANLDKYNDYRAAIAGKPKPYGKTEQDITNACAVLQTRAANFHETLDFHARLAAAARHAPLHAKLRLALTAEVLFSQFAMLAANRRVAIVAGPPDAAFHPAIVLPDGAPQVGFNNIGNPAPLPGQPPVTSGFVAVNGLLDLKTSGVNALAVDVDGAVARLKGLRATADNQILAGFAQASGTLATPGSVAEDDSTAGKFGEQPAGPPALGVDGISLVVDRGVQLPAATSRQIALDNALKGAPTAKTTLTNGEIKNGNAVVMTVPGIEQALVKGWRLDVRDVTPGSKAPEWRSLHRRTTEYRLAAGNLAFSVIDNEGSLSTAAVVQTLDAKQSDVRAVHPALAIWRGWSLSAPYPAKTVGPSLGDEPDVADPTNDAVANLGLSVTHASAKGLPRFRYGRQYQFRVRAVDLAGGGRPVSDPAQDFVTPPITLTRSAPVEPPVPTYVRSAVTTALDGPLAGASIERMVVRTLAPDQKETPRATRRLFYPPRVGTGVAEFHGVFDDSTTGKLDATKFGGLHAKLKQLDHADVDKPPADHPNNRLDKQSVALEYEVKFNALFPASPIPTVPPAPPAKPVERTDQLVMRDDRLPINYIPDPAANGIALRLQPVRHVSAPAAAQLNYGYDIWPARRPLLVTLQAGPVKSFILKDGELLVTLPPGEAAELLVSSLVAPEARAGMYVRHQAARIAGADAVRIAQLDTDIIAGRNWMVAPPRRIQLVHAVQKPLVAPVPQKQQPVPMLPQKFDALTLKRAGDRHATVRILATIHRNSTGEVNVTARWHEPHDPTPNDAQSDPTVREIASTTAFTHRLGKADMAATDMVGAPLVSTAALPLEGRHNLPDTMARRIVYTPNAVSRFREYMPANIRQPAQTAAAAMTTTGTDGIGYVLSSNVPPPPRIAYVVPFFDWVDNPQPTSMARLRKGNGLRVYLERPWFATGFNEMLAVVVDECQRGQDPLYRSEAIKPATQKLTPEDFAGHIIHPATKEPKCWATPVGAQHKIEAFALPPVPARVLLKPVGSFEKERKVFVLPYLVDWDAERGLWFADIEIPAVFPNAIRDFAPYRFVRLALARYQPMSVPMTVGGELTGIPPLAPMVMDAAGMAALPVSRLEVNESFDLHLSERILTDFCQLMPDRLAAIAKVPGCWRQVLITGLGDGRQGFFGDGNDPQLKFDLRVEFLPIGGNPDFDWQAIGVRLAPIFQGEPPNPFILFAQKILETVGPYPEGATFRIMVMERDFSRAAQQFPERLIYFDTFATDDTPFPGNS